MSARLGDWTALEEVVSERLSAPSARWLAAVLDRDPDTLHEDSPLPPGWHWIYLQPAVPRSEWGDDGHPRRGGFLPPIPLPRRMWAGGRIRFPGALRLGEPAERRSRVLEVREKHGRSGRFFLVTVQHLISGPSGLAIEEEQDLVYREAPGPEDGMAVVAPDAEPADWREPFITDPVFLFRFSALTANGHRIHYDHPYATEVEGYRDLVVHGPLLALLLLEAARQRTEMPLGAFGYRALAPLFVGERFELCGVSDPAGVSQLRVVGPRGLAMRATAEFRPTGT